MTSHRTAPAGSDPAQGITALLEARYRDHADFAALIVTPEEAPQAVRAAVSQVAGCWQVVLSAPDAAAAAWQILRAALVARAAPQALAPVAHLTAAQQDLVLMRHVLGWSDTRITTVTGLDQAALAAATRALTGTAKPPTAHVPRQG
ncbi:hypothetical protein AB0D10_41580 [Kitasatospora sp. NPDC048545]|uniref:hypothetical protein n=1 Tax=Kitasatospora sp. NPDC048545 TaxID=3157208 RepID=UPI0033E171A9